MGRDLTAAEAVRLAGIDPRRATRLAEDALAAAGRDRDAAAQATRALGLVARERRDLEGARRWLQRSVHHARAGGLPQREAEARLSLALVDAMVGRFGVALAGLDAASGLAGAPEGAIAAQRALVLTQAGRFAEALGAYDVAIDLALAAGADDDEAKLRNNRAILQCWRGDTVAAEADVRRAAELAAAAGNDYAAVAAAQTLGWILGRRGDLPAALRALDEAEPEFDRIGFGIEELLRDRAELLLSARLVDEAVEAAQSAVTGFEAKRLRSDLAEARLLLAHAELLAGRPEAARVAAQRARRAFRAEGRTAWAALATYADLRARVESSKPSAALVRAALVVADELGDAGWTVPALDARLLAARVAYARGDLETMAAACDAAAPARVSGPADLRARAWHAEALRRLAAGDRPAAEAALRRGLAIVDELRDAQGATELRAHVTGHGESLSALGLELAIASGSARSVLAWGERVRAQAMRARPARPPADPELNVALTRLRGVVADLEEAVLDGDDDPRLRSRQVELERTVSRLTRRTAAAAGTTGPRSSSSTASDVVADLGDAVLIELVVVSGVISAVVVAGRRTHLHPLGPLAALESDVDALAFGLRRLAQPGRSAASTDAARSAVEAASTRLDERLLVPLRLPVGRDVVVVPTGPLHGVPWASLPTLRERAFTVTPSATIWTEARRREAVGGRVCAIAGPQLAAADAEVELVASLHAGAARFSSSTSTVEEVLGALDGAALAHLACHGRFRADNPLFSSLVLADGPLFVHDLERLDRAPALVVLSACDAARAGRLAGDELLGLSAALLAIGTSTVVASVLPVPDAATAALMGAFHRSLADGATAATALRIARQEAASAGDGPAFAAAAAFAAYGADSAFRREAPILLP